MSLSSHLTTFSHRMNLEFKISNIKITQGMTESRSLKQKKNLWHLPNQKC
jgi:hypothetical protein